MFRASLVPTLAAAAFAGGSAFVTASQVASPASTLTIPDCAGSGVGAVRPSGVINSSSDPAASWVIVGYLLEGAVAAGVEAVVADPTIVVEVTEQVLHAAVDLAQVACPEMVAEDATYDSTVFC